MIIVCLLNKLIIFYSVLRLQIDRTYTTSWTTVWSVYDSSVEHNLDSTGNQI